MNCYTLVKTQFAYMDKQSLLQSGLIEQYLLGICSEEERQQLEKLAADDPEIAEHIRSAESCLSACLVQHKIPPKNGGRCATAFPFGIRLPQNTGRWISSLAVFLFALLALFYYRKHQDIQQRYYGLTSLLSRMSDGSSLSKSTLFSTSSANDARFAVLEDEDTRYFFLNGSHLAPSARAVVVWNSISEKAYLQLVDFPPPPCGREYQIWADDAHSEMTSLGKFHCIKNAIQKIGFIRNPSGFHITLEGKNTCSFPDSAYASVVVR